MRVLFDLSVRTKASGRIRQGILPHLPRLSREHGWTITALVPSGEDVNAWAQVQVIAAPRRTDAFLEEVWLPHIADAYDAVVTSREQFRLRRRRPAVVLQLHEHHHTRYARAASARAALRSAHQQYRAGLMYRMADHICFSSKWTAEQFSLLEGAPPASASVVPLSGWADDVAQQALQARNQETVLIMGSSDPRDDFAWGLAVWEEAKLPEPWALVVIGDVRGAAKKRVRYIGRIDDERLRHEMRAAAVYLHVGRVEGFGLAIVEALQMGTSVIARPGSALDEVLHTGGGVLASDTATAGRRLQEMTVESAVAHLAEQARAAGLSFSWSRTADGLADGVRAATVMVR